MYTHKVLIASQSSELIEKTVTFLSKYNNLNIKTVSPYTFKILNYVSKFNPDLIICDDYPPLINCRFELLNNIKKISPSSIKIIFSNSPPNEYRIECLNQGANILIDESKELEYLSFVFDQILN